VPIMAITMKRSADSQDRPQSYAVRDWVGLGLQILLIAVGAHMFIACGFTLRGHGHVLVQWRHPVYGVVLIVLGACVRWLISIAYRRRCDHRTVIDKQRIRAYAAGGDRIPWRAGVFWVFFPILLLYMSNDRSLGSLDTKPVLQSALSILHDGDLALNEYVDNTSPPYYVCNLDGGYYSLFSTGPVIAAVPFVQVAQWLGADLDDPDIRPRFEKAIAALLASITVMLMFFVLLRIADPASAIVLTILFALASSQWSVSSQAMWQHGLVALCAVGVLLVEYHGKAKVSFTPTALQGALLAFAVACRPTAVILAVVMGLLIMFRRPRRLFPLALGAAVCYAPFLLLHLRVYHSVFGPYFHADYAGKWAASYHDSIPGNLISPGRGLLVYQPWVVLGSAALLPALGRRIGRGMTAALLAWCVLHFLLVSRYTHWWGGHSYGPRFLTELAPAFVILAAPLVMRAWRVQAGRVVIVALAGIAIYLQAIGVYSRNARYWSKTPVNVDYMPSRLWDWQDPPFLYPWELIPGRNETSENYRHHRRAQHFPSCWPNEAKWLRSRGEDPPSEPAARDRPGDVQAVAPEDLPAQTGLADGVQARDRAVALVEDFKTFVDRGAAFGGGEPRLGRAEQYPPRAFERLAVVGATKRVRALALRVIIVGVDGLLQCVGGDVAARGEVR
jgi:hypothetical protein